MIEQMMRDLEAGYAVELPWRTWLAQRMISMPRVKFVREGYSCVLYMY